MLAAGAALGVWWLYRSENRLATYWKETELATIRMVDYILAIPLHQCSHAVHDVENGERRPTLVWSLGIINNYTNELEKSVSTKLWIFESTKHSLNERLGRMKKYREQLESRRDVVDLMDQSLLVMLDETGSAKWADMLLHNGVRRFKNLTGLEGTKGVETLMRLLPGLTFGEASELLIEARDRSSRAADANVPILSSTTPSPLARACMRHERPRVGRRVRFKV